MSNKIRVKMVDGMWFESTTDSLARAENGFFEATEPGGDKLFSINRRHVLYYWFD